MNLLGVIRRKLENWIGNKIRPWTIGTVFRLNDRGEFYCRGIPPAGFKTVILERYDGLHAIVCSAHDRSLTVRLPITLLNGCWEVVGNENCDRLLYLMKGNEKTYVRVLSRNPFFYESTCRDVETKQVILNVDWGLLEPLIKYPSRKIKERTEQL